MAPKFEVVEKDQGWEAMAKALKSFADGKTFVQAGIFGTKAEKDHRSGEATVAKIAAVHEFGCTIERGGVQIVIPERSFIRSTWAGKRGEYYSELRAVFEALLARRLTAAQIPAVMARLGMRIVAEFQGAIRAGLEPDLADSTKARRKKPKKKSKAQASGAGHVPLIDTGQLINSITHAVTVDGRKR